MWLNAADPETELYHICDFVSTLRLALGRFGICVLGPELTWTLISVVWSMNFLHHYPGHCHLRRYHQSKT